jgi:starch synthase
VKIVFATAELAPLVRVGGLAEAAGGLTIALRNAGVEVEIVVPDYGGVGSPTLEDESFEQLTVPQWVGPASARTGTLKGFGRITLVSVPGIERQHPYGEPGTFGWVDNDKRFFGFSAAVAAIVKAQRADIVHCNDWHTAPTLAFTGPAVRSVLSLHNLAYQGQCHIGWLDVLGEHGEVYKQAYERHGECNPLAGALRLADRIIAVSPTYAAEIRTPAHGAGLDDVLHDRTDAILGIINGIESTSWDPSVDPLIPQTYSVKSMRTGEGAGKVSCKSALRAELSLPNVSGPTIGFVSRLVDQKGVDFVIEATQFLSSIDGQLVVLGSGDQDLVRGLDAAVAQQPTRIAFRQAFDIGFAHRIFAGSDLFVMPSRFEPCGLAQMQAMAYGTIPVVTNVGGLHDTVIDADSDVEQGNGFVSNAVSSAGLVDALHRASRAWAIKRRRAVIIRNGMSHDWSWTGPAAQYQSTYDELIRK